MNTDISGKKGWTGWMWLLMAALAVIALGLEIWLAPWDRDYALFIFDYWVPWLVAAVMGLTMTVAAYLVRSRLGKVGRMYGLLGLMAVAFTGIVGVGRFMGWTTPVGVGKNFY